MQVVTVPITAGPLWHFHSAVKQNARGVEVCEVPADCVRVWSPSSPCWISSAADMPEDHHLEILIFTYSLHLLFEWFLFFSSFLHEQQLSMLWHFNSTPKSLSLSPPTYLSLRTHQKLVQSVPLPLLRCLLSSPPPPHSLITKDMVIIAEGGEGQREGTCLQTCRAQSRTTSGCSRSVIDTSDWQQACLILRVSLRLRASLARPGRQTWGEILCAAAGSRGSTLQSLPSHHILRSFSSQVLRSFLLIHTVLSGRKAGTREMSSFVGLASLTLFSVALLRVPGTNDCCRPCLAEPAPFFFSHLHCFVHPPEFWSKQPVLFFLFSLSNQAMRITCWISVFWSAL